MHQDAPGAVKDGAIGVLLEHRSISGRGDGGSYGGAVLIECGGKVRGDGGSIERLGCGGHHFLRFGVARLRAVTGDW